MFEDIFDEGCLLLRGAAKVEGYLEGLAAADPEQLTLVDHKVGVASYDAARLRVPLNRLTDTHWPVPEGRELLTASWVEAIRAGLRCSQVLCFETFHLEVGLGMRFHREGWYVPLRDRPAKLLTAWIALRDIEAGSGELQYVPGSHRFKGYDNPLLDSPGKHEELVIRFGEECRASGVKSFTGRTGDVLITRGDLAVGGAPVSTPVLDCRMLCAHFCALQDDPGYFAFLEPQYRVKRQLSREVFASTAYPARYSAL
jgi:hypothetical protein